jgi:hypothetical protein
MKKQVYNPYLPSYEYIPDGEPHIWGDRLYIYGSHDKFNGTTYCENDYVCWSAPVSDLSDWRYEGVIFKKDQHPHKTQRTELFAPDVAQGADGRYYLYYSVAHTSVMSVAVCDTPAGKYEYYGDVHNKEGIIVGNRPGDFYQFDPGVFVDDDGRIYLYSGFCPKKEVDELGMLYVGGHVCELEQDMITIKQNPKVVISRDNECPEGARFFEAPSMRKINGIYYLIYSARNTGLHYYYSDYPDCNFTYGGVIHSSSDVGIHGYKDEKPAYPVGNTHGSIICLNDQYYIFNHRFSNNTSFCRQAVAEPIVIDKDGRIHQVEATSCGLNRGPLIGKGEYPAYIACNLMDTNQYETKEARHLAAPYITQDGKDRECEPGQYLKGMKDGCIVGYKYFDINQIHKIILKVRGKAEGTIRISTKENSYYVGEQNVKLNHEDWTGIEVPVNISSGVHALYFSYEGKGYFDMISFCL